MTSTASPPACTSIRASARAASSTPTPALRAEARRITREAAEFAGSLGAHFIIWPGIEGYNYPFQTPYVRSWHWLIEGMGEAAEICARHGVKLLLEHKNSEPAMKILMRNIGMCLYVVHKLQAQGLGNVQINMDWQHLIMNGEHLPEYAALLSSDGLLGHLHANDGWGTVRRRQHGRHDAVHGDAGARARAAPLRLRRRRASGSASTSTPTPRTRSARSSARSCTGSSSTRWPGASTTPRCARPSKPRTRSVPTNSSTPRSAA